MSAWQLGERDGGKLVAVGLVEADHLAAAAARLKLKRR
jgi:hypothetical protein